MSRYLSLGAAVWTVANIGIYLSVIHGQGSSPAWWYVAALTVAAALLTAATVSWHATPMLVAAVAVLGVCALLGILSVGIFLLPAWLAAAIAIARRAPRRGAATTLR